MKKILSVVLLVAMLLELCACGTAGELNLITVDAEVMGSNVIVMLKSGDEIFDSDISASDVEVCVHNTGAEEETAIDSGALTLVFQSGKKVGMNFLVGQEIDLVAVKVKASGTVTGKEYIGSADAIPVSLGAADTDMAKDIATIKEMLSKGVLDYGASFVSMAASAYSVLGSLGIVKTKQLDNIELIQKGVSQLSGQVDALSQKLDTVYVDLKAELDKINDTARETLRNTYAQNWHAFETDYMNTNDGLFRKIGTFDNLYSANFCKFSSRKDGTFSVYYDVGGNVTVPLSDIHEEGEEWLSIDNTVIDESKTVSFTIDANTFKKSNALKIKAIDNETYANTFHGELKAALLTDDKVTEENIDAVLEDALSALSTDVIIETMNTVGDNGTVGDDLIDSFVLFCDKLCEREANPIVSYQKLITAHYNFQREAQGDIENFNGFILAKAVQGLEYAELASRFGSVRESKKQMIHPAAQKVADYCDANNGLMPEKAGTQYCYITQSYVTATQYQALLRETVTCHLGERIFYTAGVYDEHQYSLEWDKMPQNVIRTSDLADIYAVYQAMFANGITTLSFKDYFIHSLAADSVYGADITNLKAVGLISGQQSGKRNFSLDGTTRLRTYGDIFSGRSKGAAVHAPCEYFEPDKEYAIGTESADTDAEKEYFAEHSSLYSDVMDITNGKFYTDKQLVSGAMYIEEHPYFAVAELWEFGGAANLSNQSDWWHVEHDYYGDPTKISSWNAYYTNYIYYVLQGNATFWAIVNAA